MADREDVIEGENVVLYPIFLDLSGRRCVVVGGGGVADRKARKLLQARAEVVVISPEVGAELESVAVEIHRREYREGDLEGAYLAFAATNVRKVNAAVAREAKERGILVNVADSPSEGDFALPSTLRRGRLQVAVSTGGASPTLARRIRGELEEAFGPEWAGIVEEFDRARRSGQERDERLEGEVSRCLSRLRG
ncbi:MAG TPA: bifunctional precorrin-2 dehydrogenase/sirohydrochlorin ferrochelatase [Rubrobacteraceae bacterium]|nr:bifunctional precorrin-2 dehydrogenase/sirohydrochlorin ferrochelatase [Rubrobacteraceae bacterium]